tara:strand:+ start:5161 stop:5418 length:258 start_codon:yes stop_codon:yes gene_type:complete
MSKSDGNCSKSLQDGILHLRALREKLCEQQQAWDVGFKIRDYVVDELQEIRNDLQQDQDAPPWCLDRIDTILDTLCVNKTDEGGK